MSGDRKALCVGINIFQNYPGATLQGCVNDADMMASLLTQFGGYQMQDITLLTDAEATRANILQRLEEMVRGAEEGRYTELTFSLSSHGTEIKDRKGDERYDEAFCPYDLAAKGQDWDPDHIIVDDELRALFSRIPVNVKYEVYLDTCHSGTGLRVLRPDRKARYLPPPWRTGREVTLQPRQLSASSPRIRRNRNHVLWSACRDIQTSADAWLGGAWHGAFTYFFDKELRASGGNVNREELLKRVTEDLKAEDFEQQPQLETEPTAGRRKTTPSTKEGVTPGPRAGSSAAPRS